MAHYLWDKVPAWRRLVMATRESPVLFTAFTVGCVGVCAVAAYGVMNWTNPKFRELRPQDIDEEFKKLPFDQQVLAKANKERLVRMLKDIQSGQDSGRYEAALRGEFKDR